MAADTTTYALYTDPYIRRLHAEIDKVVAKQPAPYTVEDFSHFDSMHYCGHHALKAFFDSIEKPADRPIQVLELASGVGSSARYLTTLYNVEITCVDLVEGLNQVNDRMNSLIGLTNIHTLQGDVTALPLEAWDFVGKFDVVFSIQSLIHVEDKISTFANIALALRPGGRLYIEDFHIENPLPLTAEDRDALNTLFFHGYLTTSAYVQTLKDAGFEVDKVESHTREWSLYCYERAERFLSQKENIVAEFGDLWEIRYLKAINNSTRIMHDLGLDFEEVRSKFPLLLEYWGEDKLHKWTIEHTQKAGGTYFTATKTR
jgi:cyclopropane fatty-acyl-phospholipid synthase-like methyltransferase